jgi:flagellin
VGLGVRNVKFQVGANPNQVINIGLKDFSYNLGVPAKASEASFVLGDLTNKNHFNFTLNSQTFSFNLTRPVAGAAMTEEELVDFETQLNKAITDTGNYSNVSVTRVGTTIYVKDAEGRAMSATGLTGSIYNSSGYTASGSYNSSTNVYSTTYTLGDLTGKGYFSFTDRGKTYDFSTTAIVGTATTSETAAVKSAWDTALPSEYTVTTSTNTITIARSGNDPISTSALLSGTAAQSATNITGTYTAGAVAVEGIEPAASAVFSGSARLNDTQIKTQTGANQAIARLDNAMANVDHELATFGSVMNRLTFAGDNLTNVSQNTQQSRSRVLDTDYAAATTELARTQIIQQAGMAMLAQANQQPQTVLSLLQ